MQVIPSIDLRGGKVVRLRQGDFSDQLTYEVDPIATARRFESQGAQFLHVVDLDGARAGRLTQLPLIAQIIAATRLTVQVGGGIRQEDEVAALLEAGAGRVVVGTRAVLDLPWLRRLVDQPRFAHRIVLALDARGGLVATHGWVGATGQLAIDLARQVSDWPLAALLYTDVSRDGMLQGPNVAETRALVEAGSRPVIASGGIGSVEHIRAIRLSGCWGVIVGRSLYEGKVDLAEAIAAGV